MSSYALSVPKSIPQRKSDLAPAAPPYTELVRRLRLTGACIDFLLGHPDLKPSDRELALLILRQTVLFGKETDKITGKQQARGIRNLNRGIGRHPKTLQRARKRLRGAGFMRVFYESGDRRGNSYSLDFDHMHAELEKWRTAEQIAPGHSGANCSPHQSYPSGSGSKSSARLAGSQPTIRYEFEETGSESAQNHPSLLTNRRPCRQAPWKMVSVSDDEVQQMQAHLEAIAEAYPRSDFGPANRTTARDMLAAAKLADPQANADHVRAFLASKFQHKAPYPYEAGIRIFGGMLRMVAEDFGAWFRFQQAREAPTAAQCAEQSPEHSLVLQHE